MAKLDPDPESASLLSRVCGGFDPLQRRPYKNPQFEKLLIPFQSPAPAAA
jgi:hypothetical protein